MTNTAKFVKSHGYDYFLMLAKDGDTSKTTGGYVSNGVFVPYEITTHSQYYTILFFKISSVLLFASLNLLRSYKYSFNI